MKTLPLSEVIKQATPLPWLAVFPLSPKWGDRDKACSINAECGPLFFSTSFEVQTVQDFNAALLAHSPAALVKCVEALEKADKTLRLAAEQLRSARMTGTPSYLELEADQARAAIARATN